MTALHRLTVGAALSCGALVLGGSASASGPTGQSGASGSSGAAATPHSITIAWVGDIAYGEDYGLPPNGLAGALAEVRRELHSDLTMGDLQTTLAVGGTAKCASIGAADCFSYEAPPSYARQLKQSGFDLLSDASNHTLDYGSAGRYATIAALRRAGVASTGLPGQITRLHVNGIRVAVIAFAPYSWTNNLLDIPAAAALVHRAKRSAGIVIVIIHAGAEGPTEDHVPYGTEYDYGEDRGDERAFAAAVINAGASIVLGSGPHVIRGIERYRNRMIAYSLGNFACWDNLGRGGTLSESAILRVTLEPGGRVLGGRWVPIELIGPGDPHIDPTGASTALVRQLSVEDFGSHRWPISARGVLGPSAS